MLHRTAPTAKALKDSGFNPFPLAKAPGRSPLVQNSALIRHAKGKAEPPGSHFHFPLRPSL